MASALFASLAAGAGLRARARAAMPDVKDDTGANPELEPKRPLDALLPYGHGGSGGAEDDDEGEEEAEEEEKPKKGKKGKKKKDDDDDEEEGQGCARAPAAPRRPGCSL